MDDRHLPIAPLWKTYGTKVPYGSGYGLDRKSTRLNSSHSQISYAVFCLKKKKTNTINKSIPRKHSSSTSLTLTAHRFPHQTPPPHPLSPTRRSRPLRMMLHDSTLQIPL